MLPRVILHNMISVDGRMERFAPDVGLYYEIACRWDVDAILSGSVAILVGLGELEAQSRATGPKIAAEGAEDPATGPLMVVADSRGWMRRWEVLRLWAPVEKGNANMLKLPAPGGRCPAWRVGSIHSVWSSAPEAPR
jgi:riboflavin biosynthesis pyrimidine reductase